MAERRYDPEGTRRAILDAARQIFVEKGPGQTSMSDIASAAGVTKSLIHHHFGSKGELWGAVKAAGFEDYLNTILEIIRSDAPGANPLENAIRVTYEFHQNNPDMTRLMSWMHLEGESVTTELQRQVCVEGIERIRRGQEAGDLRADVDAAWIQASFLVLASGWFQRRWDVLSWGGSLPDSDDLDRDFLEGMLKLFFQGVLAR